MAIGMIERGLNLERGLAVGKIVGSGLLTAGRILYVKDSADTDIAEFKENIPASERYTAIQTALDACRNGTNDYVLLFPKASATDADTDWSIGTVLSMNKSLVHLIGVGPMGSPVGKAKITTTAVTGAIAVGTAATYSDVVRGVEIANLYLLSGGNSVTTVLTVDSTGITTGLWVHDCKIEGASANTGIVSEVAEDGLDSLYERCVFGQATAVFNSAHNMNVDIESGAKRTRFNNCTFLTFADVVGVVFVEVATAVNWVIFKDCCGFNVSTTAALTHGVGGGTNGTVMLWNFPMHGATIAGEATTTEIAPTADDGGLFNPMLSISGSAAVAS